MPGHFYLHASQVNGAFIMIVVSNRRKLVGMLDCDNTNHINSEPAILNFVTLTYCTVFDNTVKLTSFMIAMHILMIKLMYVFVDLQSLAYQCTINNQKRLANISFEYDITITLALSQL